MIFLAEKEAETWLHGSNLADPAVSWRWEHKLKMVPPDTRQ
jgi:hypothetical protein